MNSIGEIYVLINKLPIRQQSSKFLNKEYFIFAYNNLLD
jgi:hypothetical protein